MKIPKGLKLSKEVIEDIDSKREKEGFNFNDWVEITYIKEFMTETGLNNQAKSLKKQLESVQNRVKYLKRNDQNRVNLLKKSLTTEIKQHMKETKIILKKRPELLDGRIRHWNNTFKKNTSKIDFMRLLGII